MKIFNITAQVYKTNDSYKQTMIINEIIEASSENVAIVRFYDLIDHQYSILKIYSVEEISSVVS